MLGRTFRNANQVLIRGSPIRLAPVRLEPAVALTTAGLVYRDWSTLALFDGKSLKQIIHARQRHKYLAGRRAHQRFWPLGPRERSAVLVEPASIRTFQNQQGPSDESAEDDDRGNNAGSNHLNPPVNG